MAGTPNTSIDGGENVLTQQDLAAIAAEEAEWQKLNKPVPKLIVWAQGQKFEFPADTFVDIVGDSLKLWTSANPSSLLLGAFNGPWAFKWR